MDLLIPSSPDAAVLCRPTPILLEDGGVYAFGSGGCLGLGDNEYRSSPARLGSAAGVTAVATGSSHSLLLLGNGDVCSVKSPPH